jgi:hypothetical protein
VVSPYLEKSTTDPSLDTREPTRTIAAIGERLLQWMEDNDAGKRRVVLDPDDVRAIRARAYTLRHIAIEHNETLKQVYECLVAFAACIANNPNREQDRRHGQPAADPARTLQTKRISTELSLPRAR